MRRATIILALASSALPAFAAAQNAPTCKAGGEVEAWLGISGFRCNCTLSSGIWSFRSEPTVLNVAEDGPADGQLRPGDVIVAVNGNLITTAEAGRHFSSVRPGQTVTLTVRRQGRSEDVHVTAGTHCVGGGGDAVAIQSPGGGVIKEITATPVRKGQGGRMSSGGGSVSVGGVSRMSRGSFTVAEMPSGWLGFGISCGECGMQREGGRARWFFKDPPSVYSVDPGTPAADAGLRRGDVILSIDGESLMSDEGARRFSEMQPGEKVELTYSRSGNKRTVDMTVVAHNPGAARLAREVDAIFNHIRAEQRAANQTDTSLAALQKKVEQLLTSGQYSFSAVAKARTGAAEVGGSGSGGGDHLRFAGAVGNTDVEVRGGAQVVVNIIESGKDIEIMVGNTRIRLRAGNAKSRNEKKD